MKLRLLPLAGLALGCAGTLVSTSHATTGGAPDDVYQCVQTQLKAMGYSRTHYDPSDRWYVAQKEDSTVRVASATFRKAMNVLDTRVRPDASGNTALEITVSSFEEYSNARGIDQQQRSATATARSDAARLQQACAAP